MTIERRNVGKRLSDLVINRARGRRTSPARFPTIRRPTSRAGAAGARRRSTSCWSKPASDKTKILSATIYLPDMADFAAMNAVWERWVVPGHTPARATVQAKLALPEYKVEIQVVAAVPIPA